MNIYQAALSLRDNYGHLEGVVTAPTGSAGEDLYFIFHDALHSLLGQPPSEEYEPIVLATELLLGSQDWSTLYADGAHLSALLSQVPTETVEVLIDFYTKWFN